MKKKIILGLIGPLLITTTIFAFNEQEVRAKAQEWGNWTYKGLHEETQDRMKEAIKYAIIYLNYAKKKDETMMYEIKQKFMNDYKYINADQNAKKAFEKTAIIIPGKEEVYSEKTNKYEIMVDLNDESKKAKIFFEAIEPQAKEIFTRLLIK